MLPYRERRTSTTCTDTCSPLGSDENALATGISRRRPRRRGRLRHHPDPQLIGELAYEFEDWTGDDIVQCAGYWLVSDRLAKALQESDLTGWKLDTVRVSTSDVYDQLHPDRLRMPLWHRLLPFGTPMDDITLIGRAYLCVSDRALELFRRFSVQHAEIRPVSEIPPRPTH